MCVFHLIIKDYLLTYLSNYKRLFMQITGTYRITGSTKLCPNVRSNTADAVKFLCVLKMCVLNNMNVFAIR